MRKAHAINKKDYVRKLGTSLKSCSRNDSNVFNREHRSSDRMTRHETLNTHYLMDTLFATNKLTKSTRDNDYCELFITGKGCVHIVPLRKRSDMMF